MFRLKCLGGPLYGQEYSHAQDEFIFKDKQTGKQTRYRKQALNFTPPQEFFIAESISTTVAYNLALQLMKRYWDLLVIQRHTIN
ncbi:TPA: hypothetical protein U2L15_003533 [Acinetobacter nosocomialis]|nr:hypothetical protein [Acinetobacter nosocomialis]